MIAFIKTHWKKDWVVGLVVIKVAIMIGLIATYFLPNEHAWVVGIAANMLWLWRV